MSNNNSYFRILRSLKIDPLWLSLKREYKMIFETILYHAAYKEMELDDHGFLIKVKPGQYLTTERELMKNCKEEWGGDFSKNEIHRGLIKMQMSHFLNLEVNHRKTLITITYPGFYNMSKSINEPRSEPKVNQERTIKEEFNTDKKRDDDDSSKREEGFSGKTDSPLTTNERSFTKDDLYHAGLSKRWEPAEIELAWKKMSRGIKDISHPIDYADAVIKKERTLNKTKETKCKKTTNTQETSKKRLSKDNEFYSENGTSGSRLAMLDAQIQLRSKSRTS